MRHSSSDRGFLPHALRWLPASILLRPSATGHALAATQVSAARGCAIRPNVTFSHDLGARICWKLRPMAAPRRRLEPPTSLSLLLFLRHSRAHFAAGSSATWNLRPALRLALPIWQNCQAAVAVLPARLSDESHHPKKKMRSDDHRGNADEKKCRGSLSSHRPTSGRRVELDSYGHACG